MTDHHDANTPAADRLTHLEHQHAFAERTIEDISGEIIALHERLRTAMARLDHLEQSLERLAWARSQDPAPHPPSTAHEPGRDTDDPQAE